MPPDRYKNYNQVLTPQEEVAYADVNQKGLNLKNYPEFQDHQPIVFAAILNNGLALQYASDGLKNHKYTVLAALDNNYEAFAFIGTLLKKDLEIANFILEKNGNFLKDLDESLKNNLDLVKKAIFTHPEAFQFASEEIRYNKPIVEELMKFHPLILEGCPVSFRQNKEFVLKAVLQDGLALKGAHPLLQDDEDIVRAAVLAPKVLANFLMEPPDFVKEYYQKNNLSPPENVYLPLSGHQRGEALAYASERWKNNKDLVFEILSDDNFVGLPQDLVKHLSAKLRDDFLIMLRAERLKKGCMALASARVKNLFQEKIKEIRTHHSDPVNYLHTVYCTIYEKERITPAAGKDHYKKIKL